MHRSILSLTLVLSLVACGDKEGDSGGGDSPDDCTSEQTGAEIYASNCAGCHGADGSGVSGPSLIDAVPNRSDDEILSAVTEGGDTMPPFTLSCGEQDALLQYLRDEHGDEGGA